MDVVWVAVPRTRVDVAWVASIRIGVVWCTEGACQHGQQFQYCSTIQYVCVGEVYYVLVPLTLEIFFNIDTWQCIDKLWIFCASLEMSEKVFAAITLTTNNCREYVVYVVHVVCCVWC